MADFMGFILVDGNVVSMANLVSFFAFCVVLGVIIMVMQASLNAGNFR